MRHSTLVLVLDRRDIVFVHKVTSLYRERHVAGSFSALCTTGGGRGGGGRERDTTGGGEEREERCPWHKQLSFFNVQNLCE